MILKEQCDVILTSKVNPLRPNQLVLDWWMFLSFSHIKSKALFSVVFFFSKVAWHDYFTMKLWDLILLECKLQYNYGNSTWKFKWVWLLVQKWFWKNEFIDLGYIKIPKNTKMRSWHFKSILTNFTQNLLKFFCNKI